MARTCGSAAAGRGRGFAAMRMADPRARCDRNVVVRRTRQPPASRAHDRESRVQQSRHTHAPRASLARTRAIAQSPPVTFCRSQKRHEQQPDSKSGRQRGRRPTAAVAARQGASCYSVDGKTVGSRDAQQVECRGEQHRRPVTAQDCVLRTLRPRSG